MPKINFKRKGRSCLNTTCKPLILCDGDNLSLVILSISVAGVMEAADSIWEKEGLLEGIIISLRCFNFPLFIPNCNAELPPL